jgi:hypothetical protein
MRDKPSQSKVNALGQFGLGYVAGSIARSC